MKRLWNWLNEPHILEKIIIDREKNNFDVIRLLAAFIVIYHHCYSLYPSTDWTSFGVPVFFFLSGLLVSQSFEASNSIKGFIWKRFLRIYPAAIVVILLCSLVMGPLITTLTLENYFQSHVFWLYLSSISLIQIHNQLPGVFQNSPLNTSVNASLWTLSLEIKMYIFTLIWGLVKLPKKNALLITIILFLFFIDFNYAEQAQFFFNEKLHWANFRISAYTSFGSLFLIGMLCYTYRNNIVVRRYWLILGLLLFFVLPKLPFLRVLHNLCILMITFGFSVISFKWLRKVTGKGDFSYGLYIYAFPVEQLFLSYAYPLLNGLVLLLVIVLTTFIFAFLSWNFIEKPSLQFKSYVK